MGRLVWEHPRPCRPTAASSKPERGPSRSGQRARLVGNGLPSCSPRAAPRPRLPASWTSRVRAPAVGTPAGKPRGPRGSRAGDQLADGPRSLTVRWRGSSRRCWRAPWPMGSPPMCGPGPHRGGDPRPDRGGAVESVGVAAAPRPAGLERAATAAAGQRTRRGSDPALGGPGVAADQKRACAESAWLVFFDESGISLIPPVRRTWSPRGQTPLLRHRMAWKRASMAAALGYRPDGTKARLCFHLQQDA